MTPARATGARAEAWRANAEWRWDVPGDRPAEQCLFLVRAPAIRCAGRIVNGASSPLAHPHRVSVSTGASHYEAPPAAAEATLADGAVPTRPPLLSVGRVAARLAQRRYSQGRPGRRRRLGASRGICSYRAIKQLFCHGWGGKNARNPRDLAQVALGFSCCCHRHRTSVRPRIRTGLRRVGPDSPHPPYPQ